MITPFQSVCRARILYQKEDAVELNKLANDALEACDTRPEGWLAAAMFCALKGEMEKAATFVDKVVAMERTLCMHTHSDR